MIRPLALVATLAVGQAQAQEAIVLEKIGAVHMTQPDELRGRDRHAEMSPDRGEIPSYGSPSQTPAPAPSR